MYIYLNGEFVDQKHATISVFDRGLLYGDGVFETMRAYNGNILWLSQHLDRLFNSAHIIMLPIKKSKQAFAEILKQMVVRNTLDNGLLRVTVSRGEGSPGLDISTCQSPTIIVTARHGTPYTATQYKQGVSLVTLDIQRNSVNALPPSIKSLNFLNNILAKIESTQKGAFDGIMLNQHGHLTEATTSNIFLTKNGTLFTPATSCGILEGITRNTVLSLAKEEQIISYQKALTIDSLYEADECFLTNTSMELMPVLTVDGRMIGDSCPGPMTERLHKAFRRRMARYLDELQTDKAEI